MIARPGERRQYARYVGSNRSKKPGLRLFVAIDPPEAVACEVAAWGRSAAGGDRRMRPVPARYCHITMAFLGESGESEVPLIGEAIDVSAEAVEGLSLGAPAWLPRRRPRALALDVHDRTGELAACRKRLADALGQTVGWRAERRFRPHLTAVRCGRGVEPAEYALPVSPRMEFAGRSLTLYRSSLLPEGARYEPLFTAEL
jgi:2'-5' RNA ligase